MAEGRRERRDRRLTPSPAPSRGPWIILGTVAVVVALSVVGYFAYRAMAAPPGVAVPDQGNLPIKTPEDPHVPHNSEPPASGPHLPYIAPWGIHTTPIVKELQVHNLEDGGVMVQYNCPSGCPDLVEKLAAIVR